jgi:tellurite resistance protein TehA-like permease
MKMPENKWQSIVADLPPAYFALVMATGIVSIAANLFGFGVIAVVLLWLNIGFYAVLWLLTLTRIFLFPRRLLKDLADLKRGTGFLTAVAGTCILGSQLIALKDSFQPALVLLIFGFGLWGLLIYAVCTAFVITEDKHSLRDGINGTWLLFTVSTQSVAVLAGRLINHLPEHREIFAFLALSMFFIGCVLYLIIITLIFFRFMFFEMAPGELGPTYWINMGAVAITTLAGAILGGNSNDSQVLALLLPFITGLTLLFWSVATWWIPLLFVLTLWRHLIGRVKFSYSPEYWGMVFPLGMYTTCTFYVASTFNLRFLEEIPEWFVFIAFASWTATFAGLLKSMYRSVCGRPGDN